MSGCLRSDLEPSLTMKPGSGPDLHLTATPIALPSLSTPSAVGFASLVPCPFSTTHRCFAS